MDARRSLYRGGDGLWPSCVWIYTCVMSRVCTCIYACLRGGCEEQHRRGSFGVLTDVGRGGLWCSGVITACGGHRQAATHRLLYGGSPAHLGLRANRVGVALGGSGPAGAWSRVQSEEGRNVLAVEVTCLGFSCGSPRLLLLLGVPGAMRPFVALRGSLWITLMKPHTAT